MCGAPPGVVKARASLTTCCVLPCAHCHHPMVQTIDSVNAEDIKKQVAGVVDAA